MMDNLGARLMWLLPLLIGAGLTSGCGDSENQTSRYWNVVMAGESVATITFGNGLATTQIIHSGATVGTAPFHLFTSGGSAGCTVRDGQTVVHTGASSGSMEFGSYCAGTLTTDLVITLGSSAGILDSSNNYIVEPGKTVQATISPPGAIGSKTSDITY